MGLRRGTPLVCVNVRWIGNGAAALAMMASLVSWQVQAAGKPASEDLARYFEDVAFGAEFGGASAERDFLIKWDGPVRLSVAEFGALEKTEADGTPYLKIENRPLSEKKRAYIQKHLNTILDLTGVVLEEPDAQDKPANFFIRFVPYKAMHAPFLAPNNSTEGLKELARDGVCYATVDLDKGRITEARIVVTTELAPARMDACLLEEMTQVFGLMNDSDLVQPSIFNQYSTSRVLYRSDLILLLTLYDKQLTPGMAKSEAMRVASAIIDQLNQSLKAGP